MAQPCRRRSGIPALHITTAWFTMRFDTLGNNADATYDATIEEVVNAYDSRDAARVATWKQAFGQTSGS